MSQYFWSAEDYSVGKVPDDYWRLNLGDLTFVIKEDSGGNKYMEVDGPLTQRAFLRLIGTGPNVADAEIWVKFRSDNADANFAPSLRSQNTTSAADLIRLSGAYNAAQGQNRLEAGFNDQVSMIDYSVDLEPPVGILGEMRLKASGDAIQGRWWDSGATEDAAWDLDKTQTHVPDAGSPGLFVFKSYKLRIYAVGYGTGGDPAPTAPVSGADGDGFVLRSRLTTDGTGYVLSSINVAGTSELPEITGTMLTQESGRDTFTTILSDTVESISATMSAQETGSDTFSATATVSAGVITGSMTAQESGKDSFSATGLVELLALAFPIRNTKATVIQAQYKAEVV